MIAAAHKEVTGRWGGLLWDYSTLPNHVKVLLTTHPRPRHGVHSQPAASTPLHLRTAVTACCHTGHCGRCCVTVPLAIFNQVAVTPDTTYIETAHTHNRTESRGRSFLTFQVSDEGDRLDGIARVGKGLDDMVLHYADHTKAWLVTWNKDKDNNMGESYKKNRSVLGWHDKNLFYLCLHENLQ